MRLEFANFPVKDVRFGNQAKYEDGVLVVNKEELTALVMEDKRIAWADLDVVFPNERTRIVLTRDVVEPRLKVSGPGCVFPGILGPVETVGEGRTHRLSGFTVMVSAKYPPTIVSGCGAQRPSVLDMWEPGSLLSPFGSTINMILVLRLIDNVSEVDACGAIQLAEFKVANRLAEATIDQSPEGIEVFELFEVDSSLPRVVCIIGAITLLPYPHTGISFYGMPVEASLPTLVHPNEFLDGAVTTDARHGSAIWTVTWGWMNHPLVIELLRQHGNGLNFLGVILQRTRFTSELGKKVSAAATAQMAKLIGADGSINTGMNPAGNNFMDVMLTLEACERKGVKTVLITPEWGTSETEIALPFYVSEADAIVSTGAMFREVKLPAAPTKVIGAGKGELVTLKPDEPPFSPWEEITFDGGFEVPHGADWWGGMTYTCKEY